MTATLQCHQHFQRTRCASLCTEIAGVNPVTQQLYHITRTHTHNHYTGNAVLLGVHSFVGRGPAYLPQRWDLYIGPMRQPREWRGTGRRVRCMCMLRRVEEGTVGVSSLSGVSKRAPLGVAYCLAKPGDLAASACFGSHGHWACHALMHMSQDYESSYHLPPTHILYKSKFTVNVFWFISAEHLDSQVDELKQMTTPYS